MNGIPSCMKFSLLCCCALLSVNIQASETDREWDLLMEPYQYSLFDGVQDLNEESTEELSVIDTRAITSCVQASSVSSSGKELSPLLMAMPGLQPALYESGELDPKKHEAVPAVSNTPKGSKVLLSSLVIKLLEEAVGDTAKINQILRPYSNKLSQTTSLDSKYSRSRMAQECTICKQTGRDRSMIQRHLIAMHTDIRLYTCGVCQKSFNDTANRDTHARLHKNKKFECEVCGSAFTQPRYLKKHERRHIKQC